MEPSSRRREFDYLQAHAILALPDKAKKVIPRYGDWTNIPLIVQIIIILLRRKFIMFVKERDNLPSNPKDFLPQVKVTKTNEVVYLHSFIATMLYGVSEHDTTDVFTLDDADYGDIEKHLSYFSKVDLYEDMEQVYFGQIRNKEVYTVTDIPIEAHQKPIKEMDIGNNEPSKIEKVRMTKTKVASVGTRKSPRKHEKSQQNPPTLITLSKTKKVVRKKNIDQSERQAMAAKGILKKNIVKRSNLT
jgi:hypothetical protein